MEESSTPLLVIIAVVISLLIGGGIGYGVGMNKSDNETSMNASPSPMMDAMASTDGVTVGGAKMVKTLDIVDNAVNASNVTTVVSLVQLADLVDTLKSAGPFTVFAPDNDAFAKLPAETVAALQQPANKAMLAGILTYHVVPGTHTSAALRVMATKGESLTTVQGTKLMPVMENNMLKIKDMTGNAVTIETSDVISSNGVTHVIDSVLMPN